MSKIKIKAIIKSNTTIHEFFGRAIKKDNIIIYNDNNIITKINLNNPISIERKKDYYLKLNFESQEIKEGIYQTQEATFNIKTETKHISIKKNSIKIKYNLIINNVLVDTFLFSLQYTIDR